MNFKPIILGGGLAGLSAAYFMNQEVVILEKEKVLGGLCRSYDMNGVLFDVGPHIFFSKNKKVLDLMTSWVETNKIKRSNKILYKGRLVKYPFENDLSALPDEDTEYCLKEFLNNPYENYEAKNMLQFFLKIFGEGITRCYLQPYNEKIWKMDPSCMDVQMVERIPKPPKADVINSAKGVKTEGYKHQLYFNYPKEGGTQSLIDKLVETVKAEIVNPVKIISIHKDKNFWIVETNKGDFKTDKLINCMPLHELVKLMDVPKTVNAALGKLKYNSICIVLVQVRKDKIGNNFAMNCADKDVIFHRLSKMNFLGKNYCLPSGGSTIMAEVTYRPGSYLAGLSKDQIKKKVLNDLCEMKLVERDDIIDSKIMNFKYAYVIYDLDHRENTNYVLNYLSKRGIICNGRFAEFEYLNMDGVIDNSLKLTKKIWKK